MPAVQRALDLESPRLAPECASLDVLSGDASIMASKSLGWPTTTDMLTAVFEGVDPLRVTCAENIRKLIGPANRRAQSHFDAFRA